jgi:hypothetical protein
LPFHDYSPARAFPSFKGQRNFTGLLWCATNARLVGYEPWLERDHLLALDFDPAIVDIASQPFRLDFELDGCVTPETMRPGWSEAVSVAASALPYQAMRSIDPRLQNAAAKPIIMPETIVCDHGKAYISHTFKDACRSLRISFQPAHPDTPTDKPIVERTLQSVGTLFAQYVTGYLGSSWGAITRARARLPSMVTAAFYFATSEDQATLLDYLGEPDKVTLHPWTVVRTPLDALSREEVLAGRQVLVVNRDLSPPVSIRLGASAMEEPTRAGVFNRLNWDRLRPALDEALVDSNASPVLFWEPAEISNEVIGVSQLGSQADAMAAISADYERWVNRTTGWILRKGTKVWGLERGALRPDLDIQLGFINSVYALPGSSSTRARRGRTLANRSDNP